VEKTVNQKLHGHDIRVLVLYIMMLAGGLWHALGWFSSLMNWLAGPLLIGLSFLVIMDVRVPSLKGYWSWACSLLVVSFFVEWLGVVSGFPFGAYRYTPVLQPQISGVPVAIGFAWLNILLGSANILRSFPARLPVWLQILSTALLMTLFDMIMEPAAVKLNYWQWQDGIIPLQNYLAWFFLGSFFAFSRFWFSRNSAPDSPLARHSYVSQLLYFGLVLLF
jgi:uncharacterized membrane protein